MRGHLKKLIVVVAWVIGLCGVAAAAEQDVGKVVAVRGKATIERGSSKSEARVRTGIQASDVVKTAADSRAKLLFIDDSVLTLSENSRLEVKEFIRGKAGERGTSVFNLLDGKMRSVVGRTKFEVKTPTAVAAARGTVIYFEVGVLNNVPFTKIICLEGTVEVRSTSTTIPGSVQLPAGKMATFTAGATALPAAVPAPPAELNKARTETSAANLPQDTTSGTGGTKTTFLAAGDTAIKVSDVAQTLQFVTPEGVIYTVVVTPPPPPPPAPTHVRINITIPTSPLH